MNLTWKSITEIARDLRKNPTPSEKKLWTLLRRKQLNGYRFLRQKPFVHEQIQDKKYFYIADFYCAELNLIIELDGKIHDFQKAQDYQRDFVLERFGLRVLRIKNNELQDMDSVISKILDFIPRK